MKKWLVASVLLAVAAASLTPAVADTLTVRSDNAYPWIWVPGGTFGPATWVIPDSTDFIIGHFVFNHVGQLAPTWIPVYYDYPNHDPSMMVLFGGTAGGVQSGGLMEVYLLDWEFYLGSQQGGSITFNGVTYGPYGSYCPQTPQFGSLCSVSLDFDPTLSINMTFGLSGYPNYWDPFGSGQDTRAGIFFEGAQPVPEPASLMLLGTGLIAVAEQGRRRRRV